MPSLSTSPGAQYLRSYYQGSLCPLTSQYLVQKDLELTRGHYKQLARLALQSTQEKMTVHDRQKYLYLLAGPSNSTNLEKQYLYSYYQDSSRQHQ